MTVGELRDMLRAVEQAEIDCIEASTSLRFYGEHEAKVARYQEALSKLQQLREVELWKN